MNDIALFWEQFVASYGCVARFSETIGFGDSALQQDELCQLVLTGTKRATASLARWYNDKEPLPAAGDFAIVLDGEGTPRCVIQNTNVFVAPFNTADAAFAAAEGEGDGSLGYWIKEHQRFFTTAVAEEGTTFSETDDVVFQHFTMIWRPADEGS